MAKDKKSVLLYCDIIHTVEKMDNETAGQFFKHYLRYINDLNPETDNLVVDIAFESVKQNLKRDLKKWEQRAENSRNNGKKGGRPPKPKEPSGLIKNPTEPEKPVTDTVTDTVTVTEKDINTNILLCSLSEKSELSEYGFIAFSFWQLFRKNLLELGRTKTTTLDKAKLKSWETDIRLMVESDKVTIDELKTVYKFLTKNDFWKPNILSTSKLREKFDQLISKANSENIKPNKQEPGSAADEWMQNKLKQLADEQRNN